MRRMPDVSVTEDSGGLFLFREIRPRDPWRTGRSVTRSPQKPEIVEVVQRMPRTRHLAFRS
jgi:hypothetical protein